MAFPGLLLIFLLHQTYADLQVSAPSSQKALNGSTVVLPCTFSVNKSPFDPKYLAVLWNFQGRRILLYDSKGVTKDPRVRFDVEGVKDGNASLSVTNVTLSDGGIYSCLVIYTPEQIEKKIMLEVQVRPTINLPKQTFHKDSENTVRCAAAGFYPREIEMMWILDGKNQHSLITEDIQNKDSTYSVSSSVTFTMRATLENKTLSCIVHHSSLREPIQEDLLLLYKEKTSAGIIAACSVLVIILIVIIAGVLWWKQKRRRKDNRGVIIRDIEGPAKLIDGQETTLYCTIDNYPKDLCVTWLIRRSGEEQEIQTSQMRGHSGEEEESLLDTSYVIRSQREGRQHRTSLSFIPHMEGHRGVTFICRGVYGPRNDEKTFHCKTIYGKPKLSQPVVRSLFVSGEIKYLLNLEKFYPKRIKIAWKQGGGGAEEVVSSIESQSDNPDGSYNVSSEVTVPEDRHKDPGFRVRVTWKHESMEEPQSREMSIRDPDYIWTPVVEMIQVPPLHVGVPAVLQCNISEYFPDAVTVKWTRRAGDEIYEETDATYNQRIRSRRAEDNTYSCSPSLTVTPALETHQGAEYICQVQHPALEKPIEKRTGKLHVTAKPQMLSPIEITMADASRVQFSLTLHKFYPKDINISWHWEDGSHKYGLSPEQTTSSQDGGLSYGVTSVVTISVHSFNDPKMKIIVVWKHETMERPETRSLSIRDLPWPPQVGSIDVPELEDDSQALLTCDISGYFPDLLSVTWFIMEDENRRALPIGSSQGDRRHKITEKRKIQEDRTYCCQTSLTFTPIIRLDQGSHIICRVEHPSLERAIETSTAPLHIGVKKQRTAGGIMGIVNNNEKEGIEEGEEATEEATTEYEEKTNFVPAKV